MRKFPQDQHLYLRNNPRVKNLCYEIKECTRRHLRSKARGSEIGRTLGCLACETHGPRKSHTRECKRFQDVSEESRRAATAEEVKRGIVVDPYARALDLSSSSTDVKPCVATVENSAGQMDEDTSLRAPAISHRLKPDAEEYVSKKARVARNVLHIRGEDGLKFDVNEEAWPNADLAVRSSFQGALIDGLLADKVKAGDDREITQMKDLHQGGRRTSWQIHLAHRLGTTDERKRSDISMCLTTTVRDDVFAPTPSPISVRGLMLDAARYDLRVETGGVVCASMQADSSCEMSARPPKGQAREGWIWRLHGATNGM